MKSKFLIINADDFGKFHSVNVGIIEGINRGVITSTSLMVYGSYVSEVEPIKNVRSVSIGLHFDPSNFKSENLKSEFYKQIEMFKKIVGRKPDHLDSHKTRLHELTEIAQDIKSYALKNSTPLRDMGYANFIGSFITLSSLDHKSIDMSKIAPTSLIKILNSELKEGFNELMCHAGRTDEDLMKNSTYSGAREVELNTLLSDSFSEFLQNHPEIRLSSWNDLFVEGH